MKSTELSGQPIGGRSRETAGLLLDAAESLFSDRGYAAVGIREIVERAGVNIAAIKYHFGSKSGLYLATVRRAMHRRSEVDGWAMLDERPASREAAAVALVRFTHVFLNRLLRPDDGGVVSRLIIREAIEPSEAIDAVVRDSIQPNEERLMSLIEVIRPDASRRERALLAESTLGQILHYRVFRSFLERLTIGDLTEAGTVVEIADHIATVSLRALGCGEAMIDQTLRDAARENTR